MRLATCLLISLLLQGCSSYTLPRYSAAAETVALLRAAPRDAKFAVREVTGPHAGLREITCRQVGPVLPPDQLTFGQYLGSALRTELIMADAYDERSPSVIDGWLEQIDFSSDLAASAWVLRIRLSIGAADSGVITERYAFPSSFSGEAACGQAATAGLGAYQNAVAQALRAVLGNPKR